MKKKAWAFLGILSFWTASAQRDPVVDSLSQIVAKTKNDSVKVAALNAIAFHYMFNDKTSTLTWLKRSERASNVNTQYGYAEMTNYRGIVNDVSGDKDSAQFYFEKALLLGRKYKLRKIEVRSTNNLGMVRWNLGDFSEALRYFFSALRLNEQLPASEQISFAICYSNIGLIYQEMNMYAKALPWHRKAYNLRKRENLIGDQAVSLNNIGVCLNSMQRSREAVNAYRAGIDLAKKSGNDMEQCRLLSNLGNALLQDNKPKEAISEYLEAFHHPAASAKTIALVSGNLAAAFNATGKPKIGLGYAMTGIDSINAHPELRPFSVSLMEYAAQSYYMLGDFKKGEYYNRKFTELTQEKFSNENARQSANYEVKFKTAKKERELAENRARLVEEQANAKQKTYMLAGVSLLALFIVFIILMIYRQQKLRNAQLRQEHELKTAIARIETQNKLQEQRLGISRDLHDNIGAQLTFIISAVANIRHAFEIGNVQLAGKLDNIGSFAQSTILELRDTIWAMNSNTISFEDLKARILNFIEKAREMNVRIDFSFDIADGLHDFKLGSVVGMNLYRATQEAVNNAIKYSDAKTISVEALSENRNIVIRITDDGAGFNTESVEKGNGIYNMEKRMEDIGGNFSISSEPGRGAVVTLQINKAEST